MYLEQFIYFCGIDVYECQKQRYIFVCSNALVAMYFAIDVYESQKQRYVYIYMCVCVRVCVCSNELGISYL
jgi:hypothetical protein